MIAWLQEIYYELRSTRQAQTRAIYFGGAAWAAFHRAADTLHPDLKGRPIMFFLGASIHEDESMPPRMLRFELTDGQTKIVELPR